MVKSTSMASQTSPLYNTTWTLHALSPLCHQAFPLSSGTSLSIYSTRLKQFLKRNSFRPLQTDNEVSAKTGLLQDCKWSLFIAHQDFVGILITLTYENGTYTAILIPDYARPISASLSAAFSSYPLLLTHMPNPTRLQLLDFFSTAFDAHVSLLKITSTLTACALEEYLAALMANTTTTRTEDEKRQLVSDVVKEIQLTFSFPTAPGLKTLDVTISREDVAKFLSYGTPPVTSSSAGQRSTSEPFPGPFVTALSFYLDTHMALHLAHPDIRLVRVACGAFVLGGLIAGEGGRMKILVGKDSFAEDQEIERETVMRANYGLIGGLILWAKG